MTRLADLPDDVTDLAVEYLLGTLPASDAAAFERRLTTDAELAAEVTRLRGVLGLLPHITATAPPPSLRDRVLAAGEQKLRARSARGTAGPATVTAPQAAAEPAAPAARPGTVVPFPASRAPRRVVWSRFAAAAAAALALALGIDSWRVRRELSLERELTATLQQPNVVQSFRLASAGGGDAYGTVALDMDAKRGAVVVKDLPALPAGQIYRLWAQVSDKAIFCGQFRSTTEGAVQAQFVVPVESYTAPIGKLFVTAEPADAPLAAPSGPRVMESV